MGWKMNSAECIFDDHITSSFEIEINSNQTLRNMANLNTVDALKTLVLFEMAVTIVS